MTHAKGKDEEKEEKKNVPYLVCIQNSPKVSRITWFASIGNQSHAYTFGFQTRNIPSENKNACKYWKKLDSTFSVAEAARVLISSERQQCQPKTQTNASDGLSEINPTIIFVFQQKSVLRKTNKMTKKLKRKYRITRWATQWYRNDGSQHIGFPSQRWDGFQAKIAAVKVSLTYSDPLANKVNGETYSVVTSWRTVTKFFCFK